MRGSGRILNVDDAPITRCAKSRILRQKGHEVIEAAAGAEALRLVREELPRLVLLKASLPDMSGIDVCRHLKSDPLTSCVPLVLICGTPFTDTDQDAGIAGGADLCVDEPVEPKELETIVDVLLRLRHPEAGLRECATRWQRFVDANIIGMIVIEDDRIVEANDAFLAMLGYTREELCRRQLTWRDITLPEHLERSEHAYRVLLETGSTAPFEKEYATRDGRRLGAVVGSVALDLKRRRWISFVLDRSEQKRAETEREHALTREQVARAHAEEATRLKDEFLANLSHELRTPMNIIIGWAHLLRMGALNAEQQRRAVEAIERAARSQAQLIEDLLDISRIVTGKFRLSLRAFELGSIVEAAVESLRPGAQARRIALDVSLEGTGARVCGDQDRLQQVVWNLVSNAVKFTPAGGCVQVLLTHSADEATITVKDTGIGIAHDFLPHVFDRFRQADGTSTREHTGMGLGLAIVRHVVELHGGSVRAHSEGEGCGATFTVVLPLIGSLVAHEPAAQHPAHPQPLLQPEEPPRVLLVEDDADAREVAAASLSRAGFDLRLAASGAEALTVLDQWQPDVIVSDISMPGMDGYELIRQLRARPPQLGGRIPALALTAYARREDAMRVLASGYQGHAAKPIDPVELTQAIIKLLGRSASPHA